MSLVLGIFDGTHDAGACLIEDGTVIAACDEERWSRKRDKEGFQFSPFNGFSSLLVYVGLESITLPLPDSSIPILYLEF